MRQKTADLRLLTLLRAAATGRADLALDTFSSHETDWAIKTGLGPLLSRSTRDDPNRTASEHFAAVHGADLTARVLSGETLDAATEILEACSLRGPLVGLLKGISICDQYYPEPHLRPMGDIDLLVDREAVAQFEATLIRLGYERKSPYPPSFYSAHHHTCPFFRAATEDWVEVHVALLPPRSSPGRDPVFAPTSIAGELRASSFRGYPVRRLSAELQVVFLATHWGFELEITHALVPMLDLLFLLGQSPSLDWDKILGWLEGSAATAAYVYLLLSFLDRHELLELDSEVLGTLRAMQRPLRSPNLPLAWRLLERYAFQGKAFGALMTERNFDVTWRTLLLPDSPFRNLWRLPWRLIPDRFRIGIRKEALR